LLDPASLVVVSSYGSGVRSRWRVRRTRQRVDGLVACLHRVRSVRGGCSVRLRALGSRPWQSGRLLVHVLAVGGGLSWPWSASIRLFPNCSVQCQACGASSSRSLGYTGRLVRSAAPRHRGRTDRTSGATHGKNDQLGREPEPGKLRRGRDRDLRRGLFMVRGLYDHLRLPNATKPATV
jgi:hypothetical protein